MDDEEMENPLRDTTTASIPANLELLARLDVVSGMIAVAQGTQSGRRLLVRLGELVFATSLEPAGLIFGREAPSTLAIPVAKLSRKHFMIMQNEEKSMVLNDLDSTNGTRVNGRQVEQRTLVNGDLIEAGGIEFAYIDGEDEKPLDVIE